MVVVGYACYGVGLLFWREVFDFLGWHSGVDAVGFGLELDGYECVGRDDDVAFDDGSVEYGRAHADEDVVFDYCSVYCGVMADGDIVAHLYG